jgi:hypothetical protein
MKQALLLIVFALGLGYTGRGQMLTFEFSALAGNEISAESNSNDANISASTITRGSGLTTTANSGRFNSTSWALTSIENAITGNDYNEFTITPNAGYQFSVSSVYLQLQRSGTGPSGVALRSSADNYATNLDIEYAITDNTSTQEFTFTFTQPNSTTVVTYRIYMWAEATGGSGGPGDGAGNDIVVYGTVTASGNSVPTVTTQTVSEITTSTVTGNGNITFTGGVDPNARGFCWDIASNPDPDISDSKIEEMGSFTTGAFTGSITGLESGIQYKIRAYATNPLGTGYGNVVNFYTLDTQPTNYPGSFAATANTSSIITVVWADAVPAADGYLIKASFVDYNDIAVPVDGTAESDASLVKNISGGIETVQFTGLTASTEYFFKIFPYNGSGATINYKTDSTIPTTNATTFETSVTPAFIINELDADTPGTDMAEFIELYDGGVGNSDLSGLVLVLYNGSNDLSYASHDLDTYTTDVNGYFVIGNSGVPNVSITFANNILQNGADAVALYTGNSTDFPTGTAVTTSNLLDALVYDTDDADDAGLLVLINPGQPQINENGNVNMANQSIQRIPNGAGGQRNTSTFDMTLPTPGTANDYASYTWTGTTNNLWNTTTNWSGSATPDAGTHAIIPDVINKPILSTTGRCKNLTIQTNSNLEIGAAGQLTVSGTLTNNAGTTGLVIKSDATGSGSLLHNSTGVDATIEHYITGNSTTNGTYDFHQVSIPLNTDETASQFMGMYLYQFDPVVQNYVTLGNDPATILDNNQGFMIFYPNTDTTITFAGQINNGTFTAVTTTDAVDEFSLVPNPYPSAIDWDAASGWTKTNLHDYFYIWDPVSNNYVSWNAGAGTALTGEIPVGQSFFVKANAASPVLTMTNAVRVHSTQAFWKETKEIVPEVFHLRVSDNKSADEILVRFSPLAGNERGFMDIDKCYGADIAPQLYSLSRYNDKLTTNAIAHSTQTMIVPVGLEYYQEGQLTFNDNGFESFESSVSIFLEDKLLNKMIDLRENPVYAFTHVSSDDILRFNLHFFGVNITPELPAGDYNIWSTTDHINIHIPASTGQEVAVELYDLLGHLVLSQQINLGSSTEIAVPQFNGMGIVRVIANNKVYSEKVFIR